MKSAADFTNIQCHGYKNINEIIRVDDRLHISETLYGDHDAEIMLLGQDGAHFSRIKELVIREGSAGYRHGPNVKTNLNLQYCLSSYLNKRFADPLNVTSKDCGIFYANSIWLLKDCDSMSGGIKNKNKVLKECEPIFEETMKSLSNLKCIITLGKISYEYLCSMCPDLNPHWNEALSLPVSRVKICKRSVIVGAVKHPSPLSGGKNIEQLKLRFFEILKQSCLI